MASLLVNSERVSLPIDLSSLTQLPIMSEAQFYEFCRTNPDLRIERNADGEVIIMSPAFTDTGNRNGRILGQLFIWAEEDSTGEAFDSSTGYTLPNGAVLSPDASWMSSERWNSLSSSQQSSFAPIVPDFVVELRSSSDTLKKLQDKMQEYIDQGVRLGLLVDRKNRAVHTYRPNQIPEILQNPDTIHCEPELPGFKLKMSKIW